MNTLIARLSAVKQSLQAALSVLPAYVTFICILLLHIDRRASVELPHLRVELQTISSTMRELQCSFMQTLENRLAGLVLSDVANEESPPSSVAGPREDQRLWRSVSSSWQSSTKGEPADDMSFAPRIGNKVSVQSTMVQPPRPCLCNCDCHSPVAVTTPQWLGSTMGTLIIRYSKDPRACRLCAKKDCRKATQSVLKTNYYFPRWLLRHAMCLQFNYSPWAGHSVSLRTPRVVSANSPIFSFAQHNNINGMRRLFEGGLASPFDVSYEEGRSALHVSNICTRRGVLS